MDIPDTFLGGYSMGMIVTGFMTFYPPVLIGNNKRIWFCPHKEVRCFCFLFLGIFIGGCFGSYWLFYHNEIYFFIAINVLLLILSNWIRKKFLSIKQITKESSIGTVLFWPIFFTIFLIFRGTGPYRSFLFHGVGFIVGSMVWSIVFYCLAARVHVICFLGIDRWCKKRSFKNVIFKYLKRKSIEKKRSI